MAYKVAIDAGHGSNTSGKRTCKFTKTVKLSNGKVIKKGETYKEHEANVMVSDFLATELKRCGFAIYKSGWDDKDATDDADISLRTRQKRIKAANCDISISNHFNAFGSNWNSAQGIGTFIHSTNYRNSKKLATKVYAQLIKGTPQKGRGIKQQAFAMVNCTSLGVKAAILNEYAFMTNKHEAQELMADVDFCKECAVEVAKGVCNYFGVKYVAVGTSKPKKENKEKSSSKVSESAMVKALQTALNKDYKTGLTVDGKYGPKTKAGLAGHIIKNGSKTNSVKWLQTRLNELGYTDNNKKKLKVDGAFGSKTAAALKKMQKALGVTQDVKFGTATMAKMIKKY
ncbi:N-acetylmuramoyl-L-alanine amidase [Lachnospiraceae bacterium KM106-2]|nr:N-acetylmuramoyl-L-alanine amidase [Lachnospiraceae bacterium KM106-2]